MWRRFNHHIQMKIEKIKWLHIYIYVCMYIHIHIYIYTHTNNLKAETSASSLFGTQSHYRQLPDRRLMSFLGKVTNLRNDKSKCYYCIWLSITFPDHHSAEFKTDKSHPCPWNFQSTPDNNLLLYHEQSASNCLVFVESL